MARMHADHGEIVRFAPGRVNLPRDMANEHRARAERLREKLDGYLQDHPEFTCAFRRSRCQADHLSERIKREREDLPFKSFMSEVIRRRPQPRASKVARDGASVE